MKLGRPLKTLLLTQTEVWKPIKGYEGLYEVSSLGRVRSLRSGNILRIMDNGKGYKSVVLSNQKREYVHRLVAKGFLRNTDGYKEINHKNGKKSDNRVGNLEWCTRRYNTQHSFDTGLRNNRRNNAPGRKLAVEDVRKIFLARHCGMKSSELQEMFSVGDECIRSIYKGINWKYLKLNEHII